MAIWKAFANARVRFRASALRSTASLTNRLTASSPHGPEHASPKSAGESFHAGEPNAENLHRFAVEELNAGVHERLSHFATASDS